MRLPTVANEVPCWKRIGVAGDRSCPKLTEYVHCARCEVYGSAAAALLDRELAPVERSHWTSHYAQDQPAVREAELTSLFIFRLGSEWLALPTRTLDEVVEARPTHSLPHRHSPILLGLVSVRGELVPYVSLQRALGRLAEPDASHPEGRPEVARMLVLSRAAARFVAAVDEAFGSQRVAREQLLEPPSTLHKGARALTRKVLPWRGKSVGCLDQDLLFDVLDRSLS